MPRGALHAMLDRGDAVPLTLVDAPAGWGTPPWSRTGSPAFWSYLIAALRAQLPGVGARALDLLRVPGMLATSGALPALLNELAALGTPVRVVLDDYHAIIDNHIHAGMIFALDHLPRTFGLR